MPKHMNMRPVDKAKNTKKALIAMFGYCKKYWVLICIALICAAASAVLAVLGPNYLSDLTGVIEKGIESISPAGIQIDVSAIANIGFTLIGIYAGSMLLGYVQHYIMTHVSCNVGKKMRTNIGAKINKVPLKYFDSHNYGDTLSRVTNDVDTVTQSLNMSIGNLVTAVATLIGCIIMMFVTQWIMAITAIVSSLIGFMAMAVIMGKSQKHFNTRQKSLAEVSGHIEEYYAGQNIVRAYNSEEKGLNDFRNSNEKLRKHTIKAEFLSSLMMPIMAFVGNFGYVAVCVVGAALAFSGTIDFAVVVAFMLYVRLFTSPLSQIAQGFSGLQSAAAASERVEEFLNEPELSDESGKTAKLSQISGNVSFEHISFGYLPEKTIIHDFSVDIKSGQKVAIVGPTGAGKTTIVNLLMRFYELNGGTISVDGVPISDITRENVHDIFGMVLQDTWLFEGTVRENLTYGKKDISDERLHDILNQCGLGHFVKTLPNGLDTVLNDSVTISAGQKQLMTIARAMVENAPMLILDEATSSVDTRTELMIQSAMDKLTQDRTSFVIAHRLSTIRDADLIIYMRDGDIKETGTHNELLDKNGLYAELYNSQFATA
ncbi:MAG: ABC transporter ATP-binding protein/permease [Bacteroides sp.]|nr:ABC transporter ATP-binding protein/permease [Bacillota bacterium]MCM1394332.1 ABC transporter ATP-binding protein/permease [[Eubacterium] siraeum]MCM1455149.1 ABC transporter ATP-binding protein/permease [Bacteroides sp.]